MPSSKKATKSNKKIIVASAISVGIMAILGICALAIIANTSKKLTPKEAFTACESKLPKDSKEDIVGLGDDFDGFYAKVQNVDQHEDWSSCIVKKLDIDQDEWTDAISERTGSQNPTLKELEQAYDDMADFLTYAFFSNDDEATLMSKMPDSVKKLGYESLSDLPENFIQDYIYHKQFFKVYDFDGFSVLANQRPDEYSMEFVVYANDSNKLPVVANACGAMYNISKQSSFKTPNDYTLEISQPFFTLSDGSASIGNMVEMFDSFSCAHSLLGVPEWSSEDAWSKFIGNDGNNTKWSTRWDNYRLNLNLQYDNGDYKFSETITEI